MRKDFLTQPFELVLKQPAKVCPRGKHSVSFFELVYIVSGTGTHTINGNNIKYKSGDLFMITPEDVHSFLFKTKTQLFFIRFNRVFFRSEKMPAAFWQRLEQTLENASRLPESILKNKEEHELMRSFMQWLLAESQKEDLYSQELIWFMVQSVLTVVARNLLKQASIPQKETTENKAADIIQYIHQNIYDPRKLNSINIGKIFGLASTYVGRYFRNETGKNLNEYISEYKLRLIVNRLRRSELRINEIADEFGFTDKSHLNRFFQKHYGVSPSAFRGAIDNDRRH